MSGWARSSTWPSRRTRPRCAGASGGRRQTGSMRATCASSCWPRACRSRGFRQRMCPKHGPGSGCTRRSSTSAAAGCSGRMRSSSTMARRRRPGSLARRRELVSIARRFHRQPRRWSRSPCARSIGSTTSSPDAGRANPTGARATGLPCTPGSLRCRPLDLARNLGGTRRLSPFLLLRRRRTPQRPRCHRPLLRYQAGAWSPRPPRPRPFALGVVRGRCLRRPARLPRPGATPSTITSPERTLRAPR